MSDIGILKELVIVLTATFAIVFASQVLRLPTIVGFLIAGVIIGPSGLQLIRNSSEVEVLAEIGVVLLLFTIGIEFSLDRLAPLFRSILWSGSLQIAATILAVLAVAAWFQIPLRVGIFYGFLVALSSTAIVLKIYSDRGETDSLHGRLATGILLFQDLCLVPMMLLIPLLAESTTAPWAELGVVGLKSSAVVVIIVVAARSALPWLLHQVARLRNREIFILFVIFVCLGTAWLTSEVGLSLALGAFIAGLVISESEFSHQIAADILPLRDCFSGIFFISIGMLLDLDFLLKNLPATLLNMVSVVGIKTAVILAALGFLYRSRRLGLVLGLSLAQIGEFSFLLAQAGRTNGLLGESEQQLFLAASILTMLLTPFLIQRAHGLAFGLEGAVSFPGSAAVPDKSEAEITGHVIVMGYGLNGQNLAQVLRGVAISHLILDMNPETVRQARSEGQEIYFGDGTREEVLRKMGIERARVLVIAISDPVATARTVWIARRLNPDLSIVVRTRYVAEIDHLYRLGASQVIPEEFETSVEIFARVLEEYHIPRNIISLQVELIRKERYGMLRGLKLEGKTLDRLSQLLVGTTTDTILILKDSPAAGRSLEELELRTRSGVTVIAIVRAGTSTANPAADFRIEAGDVLVLLGSHQELDRAVKLLSPEGEEPPQS